MRKSTLHQESTKLYLEQEKPAAYGDAKRSFPMIRRVDETFPLRENSLESSDDFNAVRGIMVAIAAGVALWLVVLAVAWRLL
jgi:hypothetical protein